MKMKQLFNSTNAEEIKVKHLQTTEIKTVEKMFDKSKEESLKLTQFDTANFK